MATMTRETPALLTQRQAADVLGVSKGTMQQLVAAGTIEPVRIAGLKRPKFRRADLEAIVRGERGP
jgi:excisionase family DNA binding protein